MGSGDATSRTSRLFGWINRHVWALSIVLVLGAVGVAVVGSLIVDTDEPTFSPWGEIYETEARAQEVFSSSSPIQEATFLVDKENGQDVLTRAALLEFVTNSDAVRGDAGNQNHLATKFAEANVLTAGTLESEVCCGPATWQRPGHWRQANQQSNYKVSHVLTP